MSEPQPQFQPPPIQAEPAKKNSFPGWAIALIIALGGSVVLCCVGAMVIVGVLTVLGSRVSKVYDDINTGLQTAVATSVPSAPISTEGAHKPGERVVVGDLEFVVSSAAFLNEEQSITRPDTGNVYYAVKLDVRNNGTTSKVVSAFSSQVQNQNGHVYDLSLFGQKAAGMPQGELFQTLAAGESATLTYVYEVSQADEILYWGYQDAQGNSGVVQIK